VLHRSYINTVIINNCSLLFPLVPSCSLLFPLYYSPRNISGCLTMQACPSCEKFVAKVVALVNIFIRTYNINITLLFVLIFVLCALESLTKLYQKLYIIYHKLYIIFLYAFVMFKHLYKQARSI
jgi:hypothetical protein